MIDWKKVKEGGKKAHKFFYTKIVPSGSIPLMLLLFIPLFLALQMLIEISKGCTVYFCSNPQLVESFYNFVSILYKPVTLLLPYLSFIGSPVKEIIISILYFFYIIFIADVINYVVFVRILGKKNTYPENTYQAAKFGYSYILFFCFFAAIVGFFNSWLFYPHFVYNWSSQNLIEIASFQVAAITLVFSLFRPKKKLVKLKKNSLIIFASFALFLSLTTFIITNSYESQVNAGMLPNKSDPEMIFNQAAFSSIFLAISSFLMAEAYLFLDITSNLTEKIEKAISKRKRRK